MRITNDMKMMHHHFHDNNLALDAIAPFTSVKNEKTVTNV